MASVTNIAAYKFAALSDLKPLRQRLLQACKEWRLRGTILLSTEGINLFVAGGRAEIEALLEILRGIPGLEDLTPKYSESDEQPFRRMLVRIKQEIIAFGVSGIDPARATAPKISPRELKKWLDDGRHVTLLDTRNDYEVKLGTFRNAVTLGLDHFRNFPLAVERLPEEWKKQTLVMFCTGGIRCEKAGPYMQRQGFEQVLQLDGGILKYFEDCGDAHYDGECFVFDGRVGVDASLAESENVQCFNCLSPLTPADQQDARYVPGASCPYCYLTSEEQLQRTIAEREAAIAHATTPLPGSRPYANERPVNIPARFDGATLLEALCGIFSHVGREEWLSRCAAGEFVNRQKQAVGAMQPVRAGECYLHRTPMAAEPNVNVAMRVIHEDEAIVVIDKPAPLAVHPSGRFNRNTLQSILNTVYRPQKLRPAHRLDANTTGVVVLARTGHFASRLQPQFARGEVEKVYIARIAGSPPEDTFSCNAPIGKTTVEVGGRAIDETGVPARTEFRVLNRFDDGTTLVEARPLTGRTNQIRVHLQHLGWPICGDQTYLAQSVLGETQTHSTSDRPLCLHALRLTLAHPQNGARLTFESPPPPWVANSEISTDLSRLRDRNRRS